MICVDLLPYCLRLKQPLDCVRFVGWLGPQIVYSTGDAPAKFVDALRRVTLHQTDEFDAHVNLVRGIRPCSFCLEDIYYPSPDRKHPKLLGISELWIPYDGGWLAAPSMILHYVEFHHYLPPGEFIAGVMELDLSKPYSGQEVYDTLMIDYVRQWPTGF
jgi:hypothetical protein